MLLVLAHPVRLVCIYVYLVCLIESMSFVQHSRTKSIANKAASAVLDTHTHFLANP